MYERYLTFQNAVAGGEFIFENPAIENVFFFWAEQETNWYRPGAVVTRAGTGSACPQYEKYKPRIFRKMDYGVLKIADSIDK
jgi:hypothetical protein